MQQDSQQKAQLAQYQDELARKRAEAEHEKQRARNAELVALQDESHRRQEAERAQIAAQIEAERRATEAYKAGLEKEVQRERALAEAEGRTAERRANADLYRSELAQKLEEERRRLVEGINTVFGNLGAAAAGLLGDRDRLLAAVGGASLLALGVYGAREGTRVAGKAVDRWFGTPRLVRETSRRPLLGLRAAPGSKSAEAVRRDFSDIVLEPRLQDHVRALAAVTANTKRHGAPFRHMLFYGPPGTGKTLAAKRLARTSGLDYAILSGGDVAPLGGGAVTQIHDTFDWAERSGKGLLLFIDEADAFLCECQGVVVFFFTWSVGCVGRIPCCGARITRAPAPLHPLHLAGLTPSRGHSPHRSHADTPLGAQPLPFLSTVTPLLLLLTSRDPPPFPASTHAARRGAGMSEGMRGALNAMLFRTGDQSRDFVVVLATNRPADLDPAVIDRMDEALEFALPAAGERRRILDIYFDRYILKAGTAQGGAGAGSNTGVFARLGAWFR